MVGTASHSCLFAPSRETWKVQLKKKPHHLQKTNYSFTLEWIEYYFAEETLSANCLDYSLMYEN